MRLVSERIRLIPKMMRFRPKGNAGLQEANQALKQQVSVFLVKLPAMGSEQNQVREITGINTSNFSHYPFNFSDPSNSSATLLMTLNVASVIAGS